MMVSKTFYSLEDAVIVGVTPAPTQPLGPFYLESVSPTPTALGVINSLLTKLGLQTITDTTLLGSQYANTMFLKHLYPRYHDCCLGYLDGDVNVDGKDACRAILPLVGPIYSWLKESNDKYTLLIGNLTAQKTHLLDQIKNSTISKYNDTPQGSGDYSDDNHNTNVTKTETGTDGATMIARLKEIEDNISELYREWSGEFSRFIIWSV